MPRPAGWLKFDIGWLQPGQTVRNLETAVSLLQTAYRALDDVTALANDTLLWVNLSWRDRRPELPVPQDLARRVQAMLVQVDEIVRHCRFHGRGLLDGQSGMAGVGLGVVFIRGGPNTKTSPPEGYEVRILGFPSRASIVGGVTLHEDWIRAEQEIFLAEGDNYIRFAPEREDSVEAFLAHLQEHVKVAGLDLDVGLTRQRRLVVRHNQYGSQFKFKGSSRRTPLLSKRPGKLEWSRPGRDIHGTLDAESAFGIGRMLVGYLDNVRTSELAVLWRGGALEPGHTARVHTVQNGIVFQDGDDLHKPLARLNLPSLYTSQLGCWLESRSGFASLAEIRLDTWTEVHDALNVLFAVNCELDDWKERLQGWIKRYQSQALAHLRRGRRGDELPLLDERQASQAEDMARRLRTLMQAGQLAGIGPPAAEGGGEEHVQEQQQEQHDAEAGPPGGNGHPPRLQ